jgi:hypothetical protein
LEGISLVPQLKDASAKRERPAITSHNRGNHGVRSESWRYIRYADGSEELYDMRKDPHEWRNLANVDAYKKVMKKLQEALRSWQQTARDPLAEPSILKAYVREMEEVRRKYPDHSYQKDTSFQWKFHDLFREWVHRENDNIQGDMK